MFLDYVLNSGRRASFLLSLAGLVVAAVGCGTGAATASHARAHSTRRVRHSSGAATSGQVVDARLVTTSFGWVETSDAVVATDDDGASWRPITPSGVSIKSVKGVQFLNSSDGWIVYSGAPDSQTEETQLWLAKTVDGGASWTQSPLGQPSLFYTDAFSGPAFLSFPTITDGWVVIPHASATSYGDVYRTTDGGSSWKLVATLPGVGPLAMSADGLLGVMISTQQPSGPALISTDGGHLWQPLQLASPAGLGSNQVSFSSPAVFDSTTAVLPTTYQNGERTVEEVYTTSSGGATWPLTPTIDVTSGGSAPEPTAVTSPQDRAIMAANGSMLVRVSSGKVTTVSPSGLPPAAGVYSISFDSSMTNGWSIVGTGGCTGFKTGCTNTSQLFSTTDGGSSWTRLTPP